MTLLIILVLTSTDLVFASLNVFFRLHQHLVNDSVSSCCRGILKYSYDRQVSSQPHLLFVTTVKPAVVYLFEAQLSADITANSSIGIHRLLQLSIISMISCFFSGLFACFGGNLKEIKNLFLGTLSFCKGTGCLKKLSFMRLSIWRSCFQLGRSTDDIHDKSANASFGKTQFFETPSTYHFVNLFRSGVPKR